MWKDVAGAIGSALEDAWDPPGAAAATGDASVRERLRAGRAAFDAVYAYMDSWPAGVGQETLRALTVGGSHLSDPTTKDLIGALSTATQEQLKAARVDRSRILERLRNALEVLSATPAEPR